MRKSNVNANDNKQSLYSFLHSQYLTNMAVVKQLMDMPGTDYAKLEASKRHIDQAHELWLLATRDLIIDS